MSQTLSAINLHVATDELTEAMCSNSLALFVGAGISISAPSSCPSWFDLTKIFLRSIIRTAGLDNNPSVLQSVDLLPDLMMATFRRPEHTFQVLQDVIGSEVLEGLALLQTGGPNTNHLLIGGSLWLGGLRAVLTTNFDQHLERVAQIYESIGASPSGRQFVQISGKDVAGLSDESSRLLWLVHGSLGDLSSMVATIRSTGTGLNDEAASFLQSLLKQNTMLVVGYSGNDEDIMNVLMDPATIKSAKGIIWQVMDLSQVHGGSAPAQLAAAYGERFKVVVTTAEEIFGWIFDPLLVGDEQVKNYEESIVWLQRQSQRLLLRSLQGETLARIQGQIGSEAAELEGGREMKVSYWEPGSVSWRVLVGQVALAVFDGPDIPEASREAGQAYANVYRGELNMLRENAPLAVMQRYAGPAVIAVLVDLLIGCKCYKEALDVSTIGVEELAKTIAQRSANKELWEFGPDDLNDKWERECYRRLKFMRALALLGLNKPRAALAEVEFVKSVLSQVISRGQIPYARSLLEVQLAELWALIKLRDQIEYDEIRKAIRRLQFLEHRFTSGGRMHFSHFERGALDRDLFRLVLAEEGRETCCELLDEALESSILSGDLARTTLLKALRTELSIDVLPAKSVEDQLEDSYRSLLRLGITYETLQLCARAIALRTESADTWAERLQQHHAELLAGSTGDVRTRIMDFLAAAGQNLAPS